MNFISDKIYTFLLLIRFNKISREFIAEVLKFLFSGLLTNLIALFIYEALLFIFNYHLAIILTFIAGYAITLALNNYYVHNNKKMSLAKGSKYTFCYVLNCICCYYLLSAFTEILKINPRLGVIFVMIFAAVFNFIASRSVLKNRGRLDIDRLSTPDKSFEH